MAHSLRSADISTFSPKISHFCDIRKYRYVLHFNALILPLLTFYDSSKVMLLNAVKLLMMSPKLATLGLLKIKLF